MSEQLDIMLDDEIQSDLIEIYVEEKLSNASQEVYHDTIAQLKTKAEALEAAVINEMVNGILKHAVSYDKLIKESHEKF